MGICFSCFKEFDDEFDVCPFCGEIRNASPKEPIQLAPGTLLADRYILGHAVGAGGFGIIYKAWDKKLETIVAVKEFFVVRLMTRAMGRREVIINKKSMQEFRYRKERFLAEARTMAKFGTHRNIPNVFEFFEENGTAYIVMELLSGQPLNEYMQQNGGKVDREFALHITNEVGQALKSLHQAGIIHRDVAPDNVYICSGPDQRIKLLDLGAAKLADSTDDVIDIILKPGYSPVEQYDNSSAIGDWTDIYALGATLYVMLTGVKPEESTNRKIEDKVASPHEIDPSIPENISNAVMKAMAVEKNLRFKSVEEFLQAVNREKKVDSLKNEKKKRARKRLLGIVASIVVIAAVIGLVSKIFSDKAHENDLEAASISIWFSAEEGSDEEVALKSIADDFKEKFKDVSVELKAIAPEEYEAALKAAAEAGKLPDLFESSGLPAEILAEAGDVSNVLESEQAKSCLFLGDYEKYYTDKTRVPLGIEVPMAYVITGGHVAVEYEKSTFGAVSDFGDTAFAIDPDHKDLIAKNISAEAPAQKEDFLNNEENKCAVLLSSSMELENVKEALTNYEKAYVYYSSDKIYCRFVYEWSLGKGSKEQMKAAEKLLSWMLGNNYQNTLMISRCHDGQIPVNEECFKTKIERKDLSAINEIYKNFVFER